MAGVIQYLEAEEETAPGCHGGSEVKEGKSHYSPLSLLKTLNDNYFMYGIKI